MNKDLRSLNNPSLTHVYYQHCMYLYDVNATYPDSRDHLVHSMLGVTPQHQLLEINLTLMSFPDAASFINEYYSDDTSYFPNPN